MVLELSIRDEHRQALDWFSSNAGRTRSWVDIKAWADKESHLATQAKGIYKPAYTDYALSIRQTLTSPYADKEIVFRPDGSWIYPYFQENPKIKDRDREATNRGLIKCQQDGIPVGVLIQTKSKPGVEYLVVGLGQVIDWRKGYFIVETYGASSPSTNSKDAAADWVSAEIAPDDVEPREKKREWQIRQVLKRRGQYKFRLSLLEAYGGRCAFTNCDAWDALEAAHITPYNQTLDNNVSNGLLMRADLHSLFDLGLIAVNPVDMTMKLSPTLMNSTYKNLNSQKIRLPQKTRDYPNSEALLEHGRWAGLLT